MWPGHFQLLLYLHPRRIVNKKESVRERINVSFFQLSDVTRLSGRNNALLRVSTVLRTAIFLFTHSLPRVLSVTLFYAYSRVYVIAEQLTR